MSDEAKVGKPAEHMAVTSAMVEESIIRAYKAIADATQVNEKAMLRAAEQIAQFCKPDLSHMFPVFDLSTLAASLTAAQFVIEKVKAQRLTRKTGDGQWVM